MHFLLSSVLFLIIGFAPSAIAQPNGCDTAKSTAETLDCLNRHKTAVQDQLQSLYDKILKKADADSSWQKSLTETQTAWLAYRVKECAWETASSEAPALEKIYEISCINRLTEQRIEALSAILNRSEKSGKAPEFGPTPRWLNVLAYDYPDIFWRHGNSLSADLDCNEGKEEVMHGVRVTAVTSPPTKPKASATDGGEVAQTLPAGTPVTVTAYIAIANNPVTGRPKIHIVELPLTKAEEANGAPHLCAANIRLNLISHPQVKDAAAEASPVSDQTDNVEAEKESIIVTEPVAPSCETALQVTDQQCQPVTIYWNGTSYAVREAESQ